MSTETDNPGPLPQNPFDGQVFIDIFGIKWIYTAKGNSWRHEGRAKKIPLATGSTVGLLSKEFKQLLDVTPPKGGGFAIVTKPYNRFKTQANPDGIIFGDIILKSNTLDIKCVNAEGEEISECRAACFSETDEEPPGFDINFSDKFIKTMCVNVPGGSGPRGAPGKQGAQGKDGTGDGPQGDQGSPGKDALERSVLSGVKIVDVDDIFDTAIVKLQIDNATGRLYTTRGKIKTPTNDSPIEEIIARKIVRGIRFGKCFEYELFTVPCTEDPEELEEVNPVIAYFPKHFDPLNEQIETYSPVRSRLSTLVGSVIDFYQGKLNEASDQWDAQLGTFIIAKDKEARAILDGHLSQLADAEAIDNIDYCIGINQGCEQKRELPSTNTDVEELTEALACNPTSNIRAFSLGVQGISAEFSPVFSFVAGEDQFLMPGKVSGGSVKDGVCESDDGCWVQYEEGALAFVPTGGFIPAGSVVYGGPVGCGILPPKIKTLTVPDEEDPTQQALIAALEAQASSASDPTPILELIAKVEAGYPTKELIADLFDIWIANISSKLVAGKVYYKKTRLNYSGSNASFPAGTYAFMYRGGAFSQIPLSAAERPGLESNSNILINGPFQRYWVGNEGGGERNPYFILNPYDRSRQLNFSSPIASDGVGIQIGFASAAYQDLLPTGFFDSHKFDPSYLTDLSQFRVPSPFINFNGLSANAQANEDSIIWQDFPAMHTDTDNPNSLESKYLSSPIGDRSLIITTGSPGFFFIRVRTAYSIANVYGGLLLPPTQIDTDIPFSTNVGIIYEKDRFGFPTINARPVGVGSVKLEVIKFEGCQTS